MDQAEIEREDPEAGMTTAEYAVGTLAACSFAGILLKVLTSPSVLNWLESLVGKALNLFM
jgi:hypothetical protein